MSFLAPLFAIGLIGLAIPILVHLVHKERKETTLFPSLMFLLRTPYQHSRRQRIRDWLLFLTRAAVFLAMRAQAGRCDGVFYAVQALELAAGAANLALIGLMVGMILALTPLITAWGATALVVGVLLVAGVVLALAAKKRFAGLGRAIREDGQ